MSCSPKTWKLSLQKLFQGRVSSFHKNEWAAIGSRDQSLNNRWYYRTDYLIPSKTCLFPKMSEYSFKVFPLCLRLCLIMQNSSKLFQKIKLAVQLSNMAWVGKTRNQSSIVFVFFSWVINTNHTGERNIGQLLFTLWKYYNAGVCRSTPLTLHHNNSNPPNWALDSVWAPERWTQMSDKLPA